MCGRYALGLRASFVRQQMEDGDMPVHDAPEDDDVRQTYNFAPGYHGLVYRADVPDWGAGDSPHEADERGDKEDEEKRNDQNQEASQNRFKLQSMKWGLIPFWTKRNPDYGSMMRTINARDNSLAAKGGMWNTMKQRKRCIVLAQGFYEWLKKDGGREKIPHFVKRKDGQLMCFAGLWDCVKYQGSDEKHYTYTIITTDSNKQLSFLHDRMPVILDNGSDQIRTWLDAARSEWSLDLQSLLKPFKGELECYPVSKDVGKVGNNSPSFVVPVASPENKNNIANFFSGSKTSSGKKAQSESVKVEDRVTVDHTGSEDNAPRPVPAPLAHANDSHGVKRERENEEDESETKHSDNAQQGLLPRSAKVSKSATKTRSATSNGTLRNSPRKKDETPKITNFLKT